MVQVNICELTANLPTNPGNHSNSNKMMQHDGLDKNVYKKIRENWRKGMENPRIISCRLCE
jgi:hypothetical protein